MSGRKTPQDIENKLRKLVLNRNRVRRSNEKWIERNINSMHKLWKALHRDPESKAIDLAPSYRHATTLKLYCDMYGLVNPFSIRGEGPATIKFYTTAGAWCRRHDDELRKMYDQLVKDPTQSIKQLAPTYRHAKVFSVWLLDNNLINPHKTIE